MTHSTFSLFAHIVFSTFFEHIRHFFGFLTFMSYFLETVTVFFSEESKTFYVFVYVLSVLFHNIFYGCYFAASNSFDEFYDGQSLSFYGTSLAFFSNVSSDTSVVFLMKTFFHYSCRYYTRCYLKIVFVHYVYCVCR